MPSCVSVDSVHLCLQSLTGSHSPNGIWARDCCSEGKRGGATQSIPAVSVPMLASIPDFERITLKLGQGRKAAKGKLSRCWTNGTAILSLDPGYLHHCSQEVGSTLPCDQLYNCKVRWYYYYYYSEYESLKERKTLTQKDKDKLFHEVQHLKRKVNLTSKWSRLCVGRWCAW